MSTTPSLTFTHFSLPGHVEAEESELAHYFIVAYCPIFRDDLIVAKFPYDDSSPDADHYKQQARLLAEEFARHMNAITKS